MRSAIAAVSLALLAACSTAPAKEYQEPGQPNFTIEFESDDGLFSGSELNVFFYADLARCQYRFLGRVTVKSHEPRSIAVPAAGPGLATVSFDTALSTNRTFGSDDLTRRGMTYFAPKANEKYLLKVERQDGSVGATLYRVTGAKRNEIDSLGSSCQQFIEVK